MTAYATFVCVFITYYPLKGSLYSFIAIWSDIISSFSWFATYDSSYFAKRDCIEITATYTQDTFKGDGIVLKLNANGGKIDGKEYNSYDCIGGDNSGTSMSLLPYMPVREGYTFNGSNPKTGDNVMLYVAIASMSIIGLGATTIVAKKKKMN